MYYYYNIYDAFYYLLIRTRVFRKSKFISFSELKIYSNNMNSIIKVYYETYYKINLHSLKLDKFNVFLQVPKSTHKLYYKSIITWNSIRCYTFTNINYSSIIYVMKIFLTYNHRHVGDKLVLSSTRINLLDEPNLNGKLLSYTSVEIEKAIFKLYLFLMLCWCGYWNTGLSDRSSKN